MTDALTVLGITLRRGRDQAVVPGRRRVRWEGSRGDLVLIVEGLVGDDGRVCGPHGWDGRAGVIYRWTSAGTATHARHWLPPASGTTPESCAATLAEIVASVVSALGITTVKGGI